MNRVKPEVVMPTCKVRQILKGQKALVTGANSGIGRGVAIALAQAGADVVVNYVASEDTAKEVLSEIHKEHPGTSSFIYEADVSNESDVQGMFQAMFEKMGTIDILVSNAGLQQDSPFDEMTLEKWNKVIGVNLTGQFLCAREAVREFKRRGVNKDISCAAGKIICMSSVHQEIPWAGHVNYATSKGGIYMMMRSIAQEVAHERIRVNAICPGAIRTHINQAAWDTKEAYDALMTLIPYGRIGEVEDIARLAVWLASDESDYLTGTSIYSDGGMTLYPGFTTGG